FTQWVRARRCGLFSGVFLGLPLGMGGMGAGFVVLMAALTDFFLVYKFFVFLPFLGIVPIFFRDNRQKTYFLGVKGFV
ncbi:hypothetical protein IG392_22065, partial [Salmonella enterica subsp. enterica serovar Typhi]|nr:hypothetical protein [Salmonella enterica subsp. enterica serovar Typhi]